MPSLYKIARPLLFRLPPEVAHRFSVSALKWGLARCLPQAPDPEILRTELWDLEFPNPLGIAAGFDKNAEVACPLFRLGFGFVELGTLTPLAQAGNPKPRLFRLIEDHALINRLGFNNCGIEAAAVRLARLDRQQMGPLGINIGANRDSVERAADYASALRRIGELADYFVINVSSPNTPGLRDLQAGPQLRSLLGSTREALTEAAGSGSSSRSKLLVKLGPDLAPDQCKEIAGVALEAEIDGLIVSNTTITRPAGLASPLKDERGGLSGRPLFELSTEVLAEFYRLTEGRLPLIGVGGIASGRQAYMKIRAGASLLQLYTGLIYEGPMLVRRMKTELAELLRKDGFRTVADAVGADHKV